MKGCRGILGHLQNSADSLVAAAAAAAVVAAAVVAGGDILEP